MGESTVPSIDSGVSCSEEGPINDVVDTSTANLRATLSSQHRVKRDLQAVKAGAFQFQQVAVYAVPFPPSAVSEESGSDAPGSLEREADVNEQQYASPGGQSPESTPALFPRMESPVALVLLCLFVLERRIASLEAAIEALSTRVGVPSPSIRSPADSRSITWTPNSLALLASRAFERGHDEEVFSPVSQIAGYQEAHVTMTMLRVLGFQSLRVTV
ncbi:hypothetical protein HPB51_015838 [Rhipicephalus microplus]|uniref:Uncharacterized protein n=1 Tax=Rhipicephalus microplus TaxID=6941 RepID=A0A9J6F4N1_RHIMP|nr:hypothetical protein HPB51_015838 [Rhipicephalus microplus]